MLRCVPLLCLLLVCACSNEPASETKTEKKELLLFVGITMIDPVKELMTMFEAQTGVHAVMSYGGSADLLQSLTLNHTGDIYFPGNESYVLDGKKAGVVGDYKQVGQNQAVLFVAPGNPRHLSGDLTELLRPGLQVAIGHPELGSIGKEARQVLTRQGIYDQVVAASAMMQPDSKGLSAVLREGKVDVVINWKAVRFVGDNARHMEEVPILGDAAPPHRLTMAVTTSSREPALARQFLDFCASAEGRAVFERYGF